MSDPFAVLDSYISQHRLRTEESETNTVGTCPINSPNRDSILPP